jgi:hypothetical protein
VTFPTISLLPAAGWLVIQSSDAMSSCVVVPKSLIEFHTNSTTQLCFVFAVTWRPTATCGFLYFHCLSIQYTGLCSKKETTDHLRRPRISEFTKYRSFRSSRDGNAEVFIKETTKKQTDKQTNILDAVYPHDISARYIRTIYPHDIIRCTHKIYLSFIFMSFLRKFLLSFSELWQWVPVYQPMCWRHNMGG